VADEQRLSTLHKVEHENRMASIGRLAAGVAHEINNPLEIINQQAGLMKDVLTFNEAYAGDEKLMGSVDSVLRSVERAGTVTKRLLGFARHVDTKFEPIIDLKETIDEVIGFLAKEAEYREISIDLDVPDNIPTMVNDRGKLQQVLLNLVNNSFGAMSDGGHMGVKVYYSDKQTICITVTDDGCGIAKADIKRIFEPFFSTKKKKGGTGLGLSITHGLVRQMGGTIEVRSELGKGTSFAVTLPLEKQGRKADN
jgi:signal transduction histidine kinase